MLRPAKPDEAGSAATPAQQLRALRSVLLEADDAKIRRIVGLLDTAGDHLLQAILDPMRQRLAGLRPARPLRFTRLLFIPLDGVLVPAADWKPEQSAVPRSILQSIAATVGAGLGAERAAIESLIAGHDTNETAIVTRAGERLWAPAGAILAKAPPPVGWEETALPLAAYPKLARGIATVLLRGDVLHALQQAVEGGARPPSEATISKIVLDMVGESAEGRALAFKLILGQLPNAPPLLRRLTSFSLAPPDRALLKSAHDRATEDVLADLENGRGLASGLRDAPLAGVGAQVQQIHMLLLDLDEDLNSDQRSRVLEIRRKIDGICRARFADAMERSLIAPLTGGAVPVDRAAQQQIEGHARELRGIAVVGRELGTASAYDTLLARAHAAIERAAVSGTLTRVRAIRLVEILAGPEAAGRLYAALAD